MLQIAPQMKILLACRPVDFRKGIDSLVALCRQELVTSAPGGAVSESGRLRQGLPAPREAPQRANVAYALRARRTPSCLRREGHVNAD